MKTEDVRKYKNLNAVLLLVPLTLFVLFGGCATSGTARGSAKLEKAMSKITKGTTTKEEVRGLLGDPSGTHKNLDGTEMWTYSSSDFNKKMAGRAVVGSAATVGAVFIPVVGPIIGLLTFGTMATTPMKTTYESVTVNFDLQGVVSAVSTSTQKMGGD